MAAKTQAPMRSGAGEDKGRAEKTQVKAVLTPAREEARIRIDKKAMKRSEPSLDKLSQIMSRVAPPPGRPMTEEERRKFEIDPGKDARIVEEDHETHEEERQKLKEELGSLSSEVYIQQLGGEAFRTTLAFLTKHRRIEMKSIMKMLARGPAKFDHSILCRYVDEPTDTDRWVNAIVTGSIDEGLLSPCTRLRKVPQKELRTVLEIAWVIGILEGVSAYRNALWQNKPPVLENADRAQEQGTNARRPQSREVAERRWEVKAQWIQGKEKPEIAKWKMFDWDPAHGKPLPRKAEWADKQTRDRHCKTISDDLNWMRKHVVEYGDIDRLRETMLEQTGEADPT